MRIMGNVKCSVEKKHSKGLMLASSQFLCGNNYGLQLKAEKHNSESKISRQ